ncbi:MAG: hypothetical protein LBI62_05120 [Candidatus Accumulibacter sp.]|jgi:hypothetical protein|nr:hypothetical protein [Accumulibacter sp.]
MSFQFFGFLSGLAYLALCLLIAVPGARKSVLSSAAEKDGGYFLPFVSCLICLTLFLFMPCGTFPALLPFSGGALIVVAGLALAPGFRSGQGRWGERLRRQACVPLCFAVSLMAMAHYARQRGIPGALYALDTYVNMPVMSVTEGWETPGVCLLAVLSLLALCRVLPVRLPVSGDAGEAFLSALSAELWSLAAIALWVCLFFPFSFAFDQASSISAVGGLALNALVFWVKVLGLKLVIGSRIGDQGHGSADETPAS